MERGQKVRESFGRIIDQKLFLYLLDLEIKRARRYQNFISILYLKIHRISNDGNSWSPETCRETLGDLLSVEMRESDILAFLGEESLVVLLPYADLQMAERAKERFKETLQYFDFRRMGYEITIDQFCFPANGADTRDLLGKLFQSPSEKERGVKI